jgi:hypothetical protein
MKLQMLIEQADLDMSLSHIKAFFLGILSAQKPLPFPKALEELLAESPEAKATLSDELKKLWDELSQNKDKELKNLLPLQKDIRVFLGEAQAQLDYFLTAMSLSGTHLDSCADEDTADLLDELEDTVMDLEEYLSDKDASKEDGEELKDFLMETWEDFLITKPF